MKPQAWHWPDKAIGKREARRLRKEHNALFNSHFELVEAMKGIRDLLKRYNNGPFSADCVRIAEAALFKAEQ